MAMEYAMIPQNRNGIRRDWIWAKPLTGTHWDHVKVKCSPDGEDHRRLLQASRDRHDWLFIMRTHYLDPTVTITMRRPHIALNSMV